MMASGEGLCCPGCLLQLLIALQQDFIQEPVVCNGGCVETSCKDPCTLRSEVLHRMRSRVALYNGGTGGLPDARTMALYHEHCDFQKQASRLVQRIICQTPALTAKEGWAMHA